LVVALTNYDSTGLWPIVTTIEEDFSNLVSMPQQSGEYGYQAAPWKSQRLSFKNASWKISKPELERSMREIESRGLQLFLFSIDAPLSLLFNFTQVDEHGLYPLEDYRVGPFMIDQNSAYFVGSDTP
jgi:hypothetical protein